jgi:hypothetical protein
VHKQAPLNRLRLSPVQYLATFVFIQILLLSLFVAYVSAFPSQLPAPRFSSSESFNEKARWLRNAGTMSCDMLIAGSSIALNNVDALGIKRTLGENAVLNTGSWGLTIPESAALLSILAPMCRPRIIIVAAFIGDFGPIGRKAIDWPLFARYISGAPAAEMYLRTFDPSYYVRALLHRRQYSTKKASIYESLQFDETGSVLLDCDRFEVDEARWNGYKSSPAADRRLIGSDLDALTAIGQIAREQSAQFIFVVPPLRTVAQSVVNETDNAKEIWREITRTVEAAGGSILSLSGSTSFDDSNFVDYAHLNACGAKKVAASIVLAIRKVDGRQ